jgi:Cytochrome C oxidase, cbb3-type, subunit III
MEKILKRALFTVSFLSLIILFVAATFIQDSLEVGDIQDNSGDEEVWKAPDSAKTHKNPLEKFKGNAKITDLGKKLYAQQCATCHGDLGLGDGSSARFLEKQPRDLTSSPVQSETDGEIFWKIDNGNPPMPTFEEILTEKEMWMLVNYIRTFASE